MIPNTNFKEYKHEKINEWEEFIPSKNGVLIGGLTFLKDWILRTEISDALSKIFVRNVKTNHEEELIFTDEKVISPGVSLVQKDKNTDTIRIGYESPISNHSIITRRERNKKN